MIRKLKHRSREILAALAITVAAVLVMLLAVGQDNVDNGPPVALVAPKR
jgi:hypothetical protein